MSLPASPPKRRDLKNPYGSSVGTSEPVPASKPDLRRYPRKHTYPVCPPEVSHGQRREWRRERQRTRPEVTRWRLDSGGVVDQVGDVRTATLSCRRCGSWFAVSRTAVGGRIPTAPWPEFCSETCREHVAGIARARGSRRQREGTSTPRKRAEVRTFDPSAPDAWQTAYDLVIAANPPTSTPTAYNAARTYLDMCEAEDADQQEE